MVRERVRGVTRAVACPSTAAQLRATWPPARPLVVAHERACGLPASPLLPILSRFSRLERDAPLDALEPLFRPTLHLVLLVWKTSRFYNSPARLVVLVREICNALIAKARAFVSGPLLFEMMDADDTRTAVGMLRTTLRVRARGPKLGVGWAGGRTPLASVRPSPSPAQAQPDASPSASRPWRSPGPRSPPQVCSSFKSTFFDYKAAASSECPDNPWKIQNNALFSRLDGASGSAGWRAQPVAECDSSNSHTPLAACRRRACTSCSLTRGLRCRPQRSWSDAGTCWT